MSDVLHDFTTSVPYWRPRVTPIKLEDASPTQLDALKVTPSNTKVSDYVLVLARDTETLRERTPLFNAIMYNRGGMSRAERELGAVGTSVVNRCVYCAAVHASRYNMLAKDTAVMERIFQDEDKAELNPRQHADEDLVRLYPHPEKCAPSLPYLLPACCTGSRGLPHNTHSD